MRHFEFLPAAERREARAADQEARQAALDKRRDDHLKELEARIVKVGKKSPKAAAWLQRRVDRRRGALQRQAERRRQREERLAARRAAIRRGPLGQAEEPAQPAQPPADPPAQPPADPGNSE